MPLVFSCDHDLSGAGWGVVALVGVRIFADTTTWVGGVEIALTGGVGG